MLTNGKLAAKIVAAYTRGVNKAMDKCCEYMCVGEMIIAYDKLHLYGRTACVLICVI